MGSGAPLATPPVIHCAPPQSAGLSRATVHSPGALHSDRRAAPSRTRTFQKEWVSETNGRPAYTVLDSGETTGPLVQRSPSPAASFSADEETRIS